MSNKIYCPIMTIGFEAPKKGARDNRICMKDCAWYNVSEKKCAINVIAERLEMIESISDDLLSYVGIGMSDEDYRCNEINEYFARDYSTKT